MAEENNLSTLKIVIVFLIVFFMISVGVLTIKSNNSAQFENIGYFEKGNPPARVYTYFTSCEDFTKIKEHAKNQPWEEGGILQVFYFDTREYTPNVDHLSLNFHPEFKQHCTALYRKFTNGEETFKRYPYR